MEEPSNYKNFNDEYKESVKFSIDSGNYFKDAFSWYNTVYIKPSVDRTSLIFAFVLSVFIIYNVVNLILYLLHLKEDIYIAIREKDLLKY